MKTKGGNEMRKITFIIIALGVILSLQCCASVEKKLPEPEGQLLTQSELEQLYKHACVIRASWIEYNVLIKLIIYAISIGESEKKINHNPQKPLHLILSNYV